MWPALWGGSLLYHSFGMLINILLEAVLLVLVNDNFRVHYRLFFWVINYPPLELALISQATRPANNEMLAEYEDARLAIYRVS
jgi:hypothetical protein